MTEYWLPTHATANTLGQSPNRLDGPVKSTGRARYSHDIHLPGMLYAKMLLSPHAHARIVALNVEPAKLLKGVKVVHVIQDVGTEIQWAHDEIVAIAAVSEEIARDAIRKIEIEYEVLEHFVNERRATVDSLKLFPEEKEPQVKKKGDTEASFAKASVIVEQTLGLPQIAHMCLEPHGQVATWQDDEMTVFASTQSVSVLPTQFVDGGIDVPASNIRIRTDYMGGGFGAKFNPDRWGVVGAKMAREAGLPVQIFLDRDQEVAVAGSRPSAYASMKIGADAEGRLTGFEAKSWGSGGRPGTGPTPIPYVFDVPNQSLLHHSVPTHKAGSRAWRAPNHPQACFLTLAMVDDVAAELGMDPIKLLRKNLDLAPKRFRSTWEEQFDIAVELSDWKNLWRPRSERSGVVRRGLGVSMHTWGGRGHRSNCEVVVQPDGSVEARIGTQDLGTGTRTVIAMVLADTFGLELDQVKVSMGDSRYPQSGPSGGSTTVGGVSGSTRRASQDALGQVFERVAPALGVEVGDLEARSGQIRSQSDPTLKMSWVEAASLLGVTPVTATNRNPGKGQLNDSGVGGVQIADVTVDLETGVVQLNRMVAVQDCGLVINPKLAVSQVHGGLIMGIGYSLYEEFIEDPITGRLLNADMEFYKLAGLVDVGVLDVHLMTGDGHDERGVIGLGEPPVISPGAAISNAVANAIGVRVPELPMTPGRILDALAGRSSGLEWPGFPESASKANKEKA